MARTPNSFSERAGAFAGARHFEDLSKGYPLVCGTLSLPWAMLERILSRCADDAEMNTRTTSADAQSKVLQSGVLQLGYSLPRRPGAAWKHGGLSAGL